MARNSEKSAQKPRASQMSESKKDQALVDALADIEKRYGHGAIMKLGDAKDFGSLPSRGVNVIDVIGMARTPSGDGSWIARSNRRAYAFGHAQDFRTRAGA